MALKDDLISVWELSEASGDALDSFGSNDLTETSGTIDAAAGPGVLSGSRDFETGDTEYFAIASNTDLQVADIAFSVQAWVNLESKPAGFPFILGKWGDAGVREYTLAFGTTADRFSFFKSNDGTTQTEVRLNNLGSPTLGVWYLLHAWHDPVANVIAISANAGTPNTFSTSTGVFTGTQPFQIGQDPTMGGIGYLDAKVAQVAFWKKVLTSGERATLYSGGNGHPYAVWDVFNTQPVERVTYGPPIAFAPWTYSLPPLVKRVPQPAIEMRTVPPSQPTHQMPTTGPFLPGSPWTPGFFIPPFHGIGVNTPPSPETPTGPGRGKFRPYKARVPKHKGRTNERRMARSSEHDYYVFNSLITRGELVKTGPATWKLRAGGVTLERDPANTDDVTQGLNPGVIWVNTLTQKAFVCLSNQLDNAVWLALN